MAVVDKKRALFLCGMTELLGGVEKGALFTPANLTHLEVGGSSIGSMEVKL